MKNKTSKSVDPVTMLYAAIRLHIRTRPLYCATLT